MTRVNVAAAIIIYVMLALMFWSAAGDSAIMDELAHIPAGYAYVTEFDYRLNPEHPPLLKALSGLSAWLFARPYFPTDTKAWQEDINGQWDQGRIFLYESGNNADSIIFWSRLPVILLTAVFAWLLFAWTKKHFAGSAALIVLLLFAFSPTVLAHGHYVTTDVGAAFGFFIAIISFLAFLQRPSWRNMLVAGLALGAGLLLKFSVVLVIPVLFFALLIRILGEPFAGFYQRFGLAWHLLGKTAAVGGLAVLLIWVVYTPFVWRYPQEKQLADATFILNSYGFRPAVEVNLAMIKNPLTRPLGEYLLGVLMVQQRAAGGHTSYFLGNVSAAGSSLYFPLLYALKEPLPFHLLTLIAVLYAIKRLGAFGRALKNRSVRLFESVQSSMRSHIIEWTAAAFIIFYWTLSIKSPLNIGVRHVIPSLPFLYLLAAQGLMFWLKGAEIPNPTTWHDVASRLFAMTVGAIPKYLLVIGLAAWMVLGTVDAAPHFLAFYNKLGGGIEHGHLIAADSNYDWGQDLKRLEKFVRERNIEKIAVNYFGGGSPEYYLGDVYQPWWSEKGYTSGWFAVSATLLHGAFGTPIDGFNIKPEDRYSWLKPYTPVARAGYSILIYRLP